MTPGTTWAELAALTLPRQFPEVPGLTPGDVATVLARVGPVQAQAARAPFIAVAARMPGVTHATITQASEQALLLRGSSIRGTVHTSTVDQHRLLDPVARTGQRRLWERTLGLQRVDLDQVWAVVEDLAGDDWQPADLLRERVARWLAEHDSPQAAAALQDQVGRHLPSGHSALVRRPLTGGWDRQGSAGYRTAARLLHDRSRRDPLLEDPAGALVRLVRVHLAAHGPATRADIAWWAGVGLRAVDRALAALGSQARQRPGPDGVVLWDLAEGMPGPGADPGTRLLPEFDAVLLGYHPRARDRFLRPRDAALVWAPSNGLIQPCVLHRGQLVGTWRAEGSDAARVLQVRTFEGLAGPGEDDLAGPVAALTAAMGWSVTDVQVSAHPA